MTDFITFITVLAIVFTGLHSGLHYLRLWQDREYRMDRFFEFLGHSSGKKLSFPLFHLQKFILFVVALVVYYFSSFSPVFFIVFVAMISIEIGFFLKNALAKKIYIPKFTAKVLLLFGLYLIASVFLIVVSMQYFENDYITYGLYTLLTGDIISLIVVMYEPLNRVLKNFVILIARIKVSRCGSVKVIGITGSYGKTSTKHYLYQVLSTKFSVWKTDGNINSDIGIAIEILKNFNSSFDFAIIEMGAYQKGEIAKICKLIPPDISIVTAVSDQHLSLFKSLENIKEAKFEIIQGLKEDGLAFFNIESEGANALLERTIAEFPNLKCITYGNAEASDFKILNEEINATDLKFNVNKTHISANLIGRQHIPNLCASIAVCETLGMSNEEIQNAIMSVTPPKNVMAFRATQLDNLHIIDDSYNANTTGVKSAILHLSKFENAMKICVFYGYKELGDLHAQETLKTAKLLSDKCDLTIITSLDDKELFLSVFGANSEGKQIIFTSDQQLIADKVKEFLKTSEVVVLFESRGASQAMNSLTNANEF